MSSSFGMANSHVHGYGSNSNRKVVNAEDPLGIMRCIDDSDDEYIVYEGQLEIPFSRVVFFC